METVKELHRFSYNSRIFGTLKVATCNYSWHNSGLPLRGAKRCLCSSKLKASKGESQHLSKSGCLFGVQGFNLGCYVWKSWACTALHISSLPPKLANRPNLLEHFIRGRTSFQPPPATGTRRGKCQCHHQEGTSLASWDWSMELSVTEQICKALTCHWQLSQLPL